MTEAYDSTQDTREHISKVRDYLHDGAQNLQARGLMHDRSKLESPEKEAFDLLTPRLAGLTYGSDEYRATLREMKPALDHHYRVNCHHPEFYEHGVGDMSLFDVTEMLMDWKAASERHDDGDIWKSIQHNVGRFNLSEQMAAVLRNTAKEMGW